MNTSVRSNRIYLHGNPWPEGHKIKDFQWRLEVRDSDVWFHFHLVTDDYNAERDIEDDESIDYPSDWDAPIVWTNYGSCIISSSFWHQGGFKICPVDKYSLEFLDGMELNVDSSPSDINDYEALAFHIYLLGHDTVIDHRIKFIRNQDSDTFTILWNGRIALTYFGDDDPSHQFNAEIIFAQAPMTCPQKPYHF